MLNTLNRARFTVAVDSFIKTGKSHILALIFFRYYALDCSRKCKHTSRIVYMDKPLIFISYINVTSKASLIFVKGKTV